MLTNPEKVYDLRSPTALRNLHPILTQMRQENPVYKITHLEMGSYPWVLTRYDDCVNLLKDERFTKDMLRRPGVENMDPKNPMVQASMTINRHMLTVDPPDHTLLRSLVHKAFTPRMIRELNGRVQQIADDLINRVQGQGEMDFMHDFAVPLPITVIAELLGIPIADQERFRGWTQTIVVEGVSRAGTERVSTAMLEFIMYFHQLFDERRAAPREDLISGLLQVEEAGDKLSSQELVSMVFLLLVAGHETTVNLLGNGLLALLTHPDQMQKLQTHPALMESAIEEMLRFDGPIGLSTMRWALEELEFHGKTIRAGEMVVASLLAANRDPAVFESPDTFDITRQPNRHIAFGHGIHYCLGAPLARMEGAVAFSTVLSRLPNLRLNIDPNAIQWNETLLLHSMKSLPVRF
ncbi:MAG: cytochrome P450 [Anaerolineae bacterium]|nr:cytochrome P450 [Anaerolineae bacterium]